ncbi:fungal-specific transcription factor domain-containing protein [Cadophora sp. MPI-SDFR-AT-0126]|nr:fungal-specific transcription factor domain-containing protein [Leotiomycetes sp. MPI-SDFR-AT-0126]
MPPPEIMSCRECRNRKVKCDRRQPDCGQCERARRECCYPERRIAKGNRRRDTQMLEARLGALEKKLAGYKAQDVGSSRGCTSTMGSEIPSQPGLTSSESDGSVLVSDADDTRSYGSLTDRDNPTDTGKSHGRRSQNELQGLVHRDVMETHLPPEQMQRELYNTYFDRVHECMPIIHPQRFHDALKLEPKLRPPPSLRYAMWTVAASVAQKYKHLADVLYKRARSCAHALEDQANVDAFVNVYNAQCWHLIATYEAQQMYVGRAWLSTGKCVRLVQLMGLQHLDSLAPNPVKSLPKSKDCIEMEERRRIFWAAFMGDRWASALSGWPMTINESEIETNMPSSETAFMRGKEEAGLTLRDFLVESGATRLSSSFTGMVMAVTLMSRNFDHIHAKVSTESTHSNDDDEFWKRHRDLDNSLSNSFMCLPEHLRITDQLRDPNAFLLNMMMHTTVICLHQYAVQKISTKQDRMTGVLSQSVTRCIASARAISTATRLFSQHDLSRMNPWTAFTLYVAGLVYCHDLRLSYEPTLDGLSNVTFLLAAMKSIDLYQPITEYFTVQLEIELEVAQRGRKGNQRQGKILCARGSQGSDTAESTPVDFEDDSRSWNSLSTEKAAGPYANPPFHQPLIGILSLNCGNDTTPEAKPRATTSNSSPSPSSAQGHERSGPAVYTIPANHVLRSDRSRTALEQQRNNTNQSSGASNNTGDALNRQEPWVSIRANTYDGTSAVHEWNERFASSSNSYGQGYSETTEPMAEKSDSQAHDHPATDIHQVIPVHTRATAFDEIFSGDPQYESFQGINWDTFHEEYLTWNLN